MPHTPNTKKAPETARTVTGGDGSTLTEGQTMNDHTAPVAVIRMEDHGQSTGIAFATMAGTHLPHGDYMRVIIAREDFLDAARNGAILFTVSDEDISEHDRRIYAARAAAEERRRDAELLAAAKAAAVTDARDLLDRLDLDALTSEGAGK